MHLSSHRRMHDAVLIINTHAAYLLKQVEKLGYKAFYFDSYNKNLLGKISKHNFLCKAIKAIRKDYDSVKLIYGSGLENKRNIYKELHSATKIQGNNLELLEFCNSLLNLEKALNISGLKIPKTSNAPLTKKIKSINKPFSSFGGLGINFFTKVKRGYYYQEFIPGPTFSVSFFIKKKKFFLLGYNRLFYLRNYPDNPFIHAGAMNISSIKGFDGITNSVETFSSIIGLTGYNSIDFKLYNNEVFILDVNPRITSTFKIYNELYSNHLLQSQLNLRDNNTFNVKKNLNKFFGFVYIFSSMKIKFLNQMKKNKSISDLPFDGEIIKKNNPIFTLSCFASSSSSVIKLLRKEINMTMQYYNCYDIDI